MASLVSNPHSTRIAYTLLLLTMLLAGTGVAAPVQDPDEQARACVRQATSAGEIVACERRAATQWLALVNGYRGSILALLEQEETPLFEQAAASWGAYVDQQLRSLEQLTTGRGSSMGGVNRLGEKNRLYKQRALFLRRLLFQLKLRE